METEQIEEDWYGRGKVIRITSMCDASNGSEDETRTEFAPVAEAVDKWNAMQTSGFSGYHGIPHEREQ